MSNYCYIVDDSQNNPIDIIMRKYELSKCLASMRNKKMTKFRIVKNGIGEFWIEQLEFKDLPYAMCVNGCMQPRREEIWVRCPYQPTVQDLIDPNFIDFDAKNYLSLDAAKEGLQTIKNGIEGKRLSKMTEVIYEEEI